MDRLFRQIVPKQIPIYHLFTVSRQASGYHRNLSMTKSQKASIHHIFFNFI
jgi:hypothetical protein